jgi:hypothetical protein
MGRRLNSAATYGLDRLGNAWGDRLVFVRFARRLAGAVWLSSLVVAGAIVAAQALFWLKTGTWPRWTIASGLSALCLEPVSSSWRKVQDAWKWALGAPLSTSVVLGGALVGNLIWQPARILRRLRRASI